MKNNSKRWVAVLLALMMTVVFMPVMSFAEDGDQTISWGNVPAGAVVAPIQLNERMTVTTPSDDEGVVTLSFTPEQDGIYVFRSYGSEDYKEGAYLSPDGTFETHSWDEEIEDNWENFNLYFEAKAGETVYLQARQDMGEGGVTFDVDLTESPVAAIEYIPKKPTYVIGQRMNCWYTGSYYVYDDKYMETGDQVIITYKDGSTVRYTFDYDEWEFTAEDGTKLAGGSDSWPRLVSDQEIPGKGWRMGAYPDQANNYYYAKYKGAKSAIFPVEMRKGVADRKLAKVKYKKNFNYTEKRTVPAVTVTYNGKKLTKGTDYKLSAADKYIGVGEHYRTLRGIGEFGGEQTLFWNVRPKGTSIVKLIPGKKCMTIKWKQTPKMKVAGYKNKKAIAWYDIEISTDKKFKKNVKYFTVKGYKNTSKKIKKLKANKRYYVRIQTYMPTGDIGFSSPWCKVKSAKTK